jgi:hypothetical protein
VSNKSAGSTIEQQKATDLGYGENQAPLSSRSPVATQYGLIKLFPNTPMSRKQNLKDIYPSCCALITPGLFERVCEGYPAFLGRTIYWQIVAGRARVGLLPELARQFCRLFHRKQPYPDIGRVIPTRQLICLTFMEEPSSSETASART